MKRGEPSPAVEVETWVRDRSGSNPAKVTVGVVTYMALDEHGKPRVLHVKQGNWAWTTA